MRPAEWGIPWVRAVWEEVTGGGEHSLVMARRAGRGLGARDPGGDAATTASCRRGLRQGPPAFAPSPNVAAQHAGQWGAEGCGGGDVRD